MELKLFKNSLLDCFEANISIIANDMGVDYRPFFINVFDFKYTSYNSFDLGISELSCRKGTYLDEVRLLEKYTGIKSVHYIHLNLKQVTNLFDNLNHAKDYMVVNIDSYYLPWIESYHQYHVMHYILMKDVIDNMIVCYDPYIDEQEHSFEISELLNINCPNVFVFSKQKDSVLDINWIYEAKTMLLTNISHNNSVSSFDLMKTLATDVRDKEIYFDISNDNYSNILLRKLKAIGDSRINYVQFLEFLNETDENLNFISFIEKLRTAYKYWEMIRLLFMKALMLHGAKSITERIYNNLFYIADYEREIVIDLIEYFESVGVKSE